MNAGHRIRHRNDEGNILTSCALINDRIKEHPGHREKKDDPSMQMRKRPRCVHCAGNE
jgi:hypothetical protein